VPGGEARAAVGDQVVVTFFQAPHSYTGEDVVEISAHGSPVVLQSILERSIAGGARLAEPGEFTLRAFLNGKLDLIQAEAVADLIEAVTPLQARAAFDQLEGTLTARITAIEEQLFDLMARLEASLDFPEEGYHFVEREAAAGEILRVVTQIDALLGAAARGRLIREGAQIAIAGTPNVGKSSVFNALLNANRAIVTPVPGTTRDLLTERADILGFPVTVVDTAGIRAASDAVEQEGIARARRAADVADLTLLVLDRSRALAEDDRRLLDAHPAADRLVVINKSDLPAAWTPDQNALGVEISALTGAGMDRLTRAIAARLGAGESGRDTPLVTNMRHTQLLQTAAAALNRAAAAAQDANAAEELLLADLQEAAAALQEMTGARTADDLLRHIFERFCIGK
jgi:tRNA modification GTPase